VLFRSGTIMAERFEVDPRTLHVRPSSFADDPSKLQRQIAKYGRSITGMPAIWVGRGSDGSLVIIDGLTRATRAAKLLPGTPVPVEVTETYRRPVGTLPKLGEMLP